MIQVSYRKFIFVLLFVSMMAASLSACGGGGGAHVEMAPLEEMPAEVQSSAVAVQEAYQFAAANPDVLKHIPCYCGCGDIGHTSNYDCYVSAVDDKGNITFDNHALGCTLCVDITRDTMRLLKEGKTVAEIKDYVDATYSKYGSSNIP